MITVFSWMRNEEDILPFFLRHYSFADKLVVWDNESTDGTRAILAADPRVEVRDWVTGGEMRDVELVRMKSEASAQGWRIVVDADEFVWHPDMRGYLEGCDRSGITVPRAEGYGMVSESMPKDDGRTPLTDLVKDGVRDPRYDKFCVLRDCVSVQYGFGAHGVVTGSGRAVLAATQDLKLLHYRYLSSDRVRRKAEEYKPSEANVKLGLGTDNWDVGLMVSRWGDAWRSKGRVI